MHCINFFFYYAGYSVNIILRTNSMTKGMSIHSDRLYREDQGECRLPVVIIASHSPWFLSIVSNFRFSYNFLAVSGGLHTSPFVYTNIISDFTKKYIRKSYLSYFSAILLLFRAKLAYTNKSGITLLLLQFCFAFFAMKKQFKVK